MSDTGGDSPDDLEHETHEPDGDPQPLSPAELAEFDPGPDSDSDS